VANKNLKVDLNEPDQLQTMTERLLEYIMERKTYFIAAGSVILGAIIIVLGVYLYSMNYESNAEEVYAKAFNTYSFADVNNGMESDALKNAVVLYEELGRDYPRSDAAALSFYNLGNIFFNIGEMDKAIEAYKSFIKKSPRNSVLTSLAYYGLGYCYEKKDDYAQSLESFRQSDENLKGKHFKAINYSNIARIYEKMDEPEKALEYYRKVLEYTEDPFMNVLVKGKIAALG